MDVNDHIKLLFISILTSLCFAVKEISNCPQFIVLVTWSGTDQVLWWREKIFGVTQSENISTQFGTNIILEPEVITGKVDTIIGDKVILLMGDLNLDFRQNVCANEWKPCYI